MPINLCHYPVLLAGTTSENNSAHVACLTWILCLLAYAKSSWVMTVEVFLWMPVRIVRCWDVSYVIFSAFLPLSRCIPDQLIVKDVIAFAADSFPTVVQKLKLDLFEPPTSQVRWWHGNNCRLRCFLLLHTVCCISPPTILIIYSVRIVVARITSTFHFTTSQSSVSYCGVRPSLRIFV